MPRSQTTTRRRFKQQVLQLMDPFLAPLGVLHQGRFNHVAQRHLLTLFSAAYDHTRRPYSRDIGDPIRFIFEAIGNRPGVCPLWARGHDLSYALAWVYRTRTTPYLTDQSVLQILRNDITTWADSVNLPTQSTSLHDEFFSRTGN